MPKGMSLLITMSPCGVFRSITRIQSKIFSPTWTHQKTLTRHYSVRRALLFVPGSDSESLKTALQLKVDCIVMDCEKSVPLHQKDEARQNIRSLLDSGPVTANDPEWCVRVNPVQTPELCEADITSLLSASNLPFGICLPKVENVNQIEWFTEKVWKTLLGRPEHDRGPLKLLLHIGSPTAVLRLEKLCEKAEDLATMAPLVPDALILESDSLLDSIGARKTDSGIELLYVQQKLVLVAKAFGLQAIDKPYFNVRSFKGLKESCSDGVILGFTGKQVIHMDQIIVTQEEFTPSRSKVHWAKAVLKAHKESQERLQEDFGFENCLIGRPMLRQAEYIVEVAKAAGLQVESETVGNQEK